MPFTGPRSSSQRRIAAGFTLIEMITALVVLGIGASVLLKLYTASQTLAKAGRTHEIAASLAEEYVTLLQNRPELFIWPNYLEQAPGTPMEVKPREGGPIPAMFMEQPAALPLARRAFDRERATYADFTWSAYAALPSTDSGHVEITVQIAWRLDGRLRQFMLTSAVPRRQAEGVGV